MASGMIEKVKGIYVEHITEDLRYSWVEREEKKEKASCKMGLVSCFLNVTQEEQGTGHPMSCNPC